MQFYINLDDRGFIRDCITYPHGGYMGVHFPTPLPDGFIGGWYLWDGEQAAFDQEQYDQINQIDELRAAVNEAESRAQGVLDEAMAIITGEVQ